MTLVTPVSIVVIFVRGGGFRSVRLRSLTKDWGGGV